MKTYILSYNRPETASTHTALGPDWDWTVVLHNQQQKELYLEKGNIPESRILVSNQSHGPYGTYWQRRWVMDHVVPRDEWFLFCDDNIHGFMAVPEAIRSQREVLNVRDEHTQKHWRMIYKMPVEGDALERLLAEQIAKADSLGSNIVGWATTDNPYFRQNRWKECGYILGKIMLWKNVPMDWETPIHMEDAWYTAQRLLRDGVTLVDRFARTDHQHYQRGGLGTREQRRPYRTESIRYLLHDYPGLFKLRPKDNGEYMDIQLRIHSRKQVELWRQRMRELRGA